MINVERMRRLRHVIRMTEAALRRILESPEPGLQELRQPKCTTDDLANVDFRNRSRRSKDRKKN